MASLAWGEGCGSRPSRPVHDPGAPGQYPDESAAGKPAGPAAATTELSEGPDPG